MYKPSQMYVHRVTFHVLLMHVHAPIEAGLKPGMMSGEDWLGHMSTVTWMSTLCMPVLATHSLAEVWFSPVVTTDSTNLTTTTIGQGKGTKKEQSSGLVCTYVCTSSCSFSSEQGRSTHYIKHNYANKMHIVYTSHVRKYSA